MVRIKRIYYPPELAPRRRIEQSQFHYRIGKVLTLFLPKGSQVRKTILACSLGGTKKAPFSLATRKSDLVSYKRSCGLRYYARTYIDISRNDGRDPFLEIYSIGIPG